eukprot:PITA_24598
MDIAFRGLINKSVAVYMDDITVYSYHKGDHIYHLKQIFKRCGTYEISLNPMKSIFAVTKGKLLGHILPKEGIVIDPERIETIMRIQPLANKKVVQCFFWKINFVRKIVSGKWSCRDLNLIHIIHTSVTNNQRNWHNALTNTLWANSVTPKLALGNSPDFLIYGQEAFLPPNVSLPSLQLSQASRGNPSALLPERINELVRLEQLRDKTINKFRNHQMIVKKWFDHYLAGDKDYQVGELVLKWDKLSEPKRKHMKFQHLWLGQFQVEEKIGQGTYRLKNLQGEIEKLPVSG